jgi:hypothetical protein
MMPILKFEAQATIQRFNFLARENKIDLSVEKILKFA